MTRKKCPGSGDMAAGHRYQWRRGLVACERCRAWFHNDKLIYETPSGRVAMGVIPDHMAHEVSRRS